MCLRKATPDLFDGARILATEVWGAWRPDTLPYFMDLVGKSP